MLRDRAGEVSRLVELEFGVRTGHPSDDATRSFAVTSVTDPVGNTYATTYDAHSLLATSTW